MSALAGQSVLLTGATGGLGPAIARALSGAGARLVLSARSEDALRALAADLSGEAVAVAADLRDGDALAALVERAERVGGPTDIVVHNAAVEVCAGFEQTTAAELEEVIAVNLTAPLELTRRVLPGMLARGRGHVVFVSSLSGYAGTAYEAGYAATKGALNALCRSLRAEYVDRPVGFSLVVPGSVAGEGMFARGQADGIRVPRVLRLTTPDAVGRSVVKAIETDAAELVVYPGPIRPTLALGLLAPRVSERINERLGLGRLFQPAAQARGRA
jgi:short-subunit dehydrogenase